MSRWLLPAAILVAIGARLAFWIVTDRTWEDALITVVHAQNARDGIGLTHHAGEGLVQGFTSAISVLVPLAGELLVPGSGITTLRLASLVAAAGSVGIAYTITRRLGLAMLPTAVVLAFLALSFNHVFYGMAGMETQLAVLVVLGAVHALTTDRIWLAGLLGGLAALARPELGLFSVAVLIWGLRRGWADAVRVIGALAAVTLPWVAFTTLYYGSPVPHTIRAKAAVFSPLPESFASVTDGLAWLADRLWISLLATLRMFMPFYNDSFVVGAPVPIAPLLLVAVVVIGLALYGAVILWRRPGWKLVVLVTAGLFGYWIGFVPYGYFDWYQPPLTTLAVVFAAVGLDRMQSATRPTWRQAPRLAAVGLVVAVSIPLAWHIPLERDVQAQAEDGVRVPAARYLGERVADGESVVAEPAGYLGYYARVLLWDHPGLTSPTSLAYHLSQPKADRTVDTLVAGLLPDWAVLRPGEWDDLRARFPQAAECYRVDRAFGDPGARSIEAAGLLKANRDLAFLILQRRGCDGVVER